ncbi:MAG: EXLDI protein [Firmicutes bacterium]|nr:EXLDI protein [Bacillota bacterium]
MPHKTIYVAEEDLPLYERAQALAGGNLSAAVTRGLRCFVEMEDNHRNGYHEVTVRVNTGYGMRTQRFWGALLGEWRHPSGSGRVEVFRVYRTRKGQFALYVRRMPEWAIWLDPETWRAWGNGGAPWDQWRRWSERWLGGPWPSGGSEEAQLIVVATLDALRDQVPPEFFEALQANADRPTIEELDI